MVGKIIISSSSPAKSTTEAAESNALAIIADCAWIALSNGASIENSPSRMALVPEVSSRPFLSFVPCKTIFAAVATIANEFCNLGLSVFLYPPSARYDSTARAKASSLSFSLY